MTNSKYFPPSIQDVSNNVSTVDKSETTRDTMEEPYLICLCKNAKINNSLPQPFSKMGSDCIFVMVIVFILHMF